GGLVAAGLGLVMLTNSQAGANDPDLHRIPPDQADAIVQRYNLALLRHAADLIRAGNVQAVMASASPRPRPPAPVRIGLGPTGFALRF
ncbi:MAG TPA: hypothetical protein VN914_09820, partial [Polyangia bacterium]|nr:hypothetical protein [Polyangia bacterium]